MSREPFPGPNDILTALLVEVRRSAGVTQAVLAARLAVGQSTVSKVERGVQRLDVVELHRWLSAIGGLGFVEFAREFDERVAQLAAAERRW